MSDTLFFPDWASFAAHLDSLGLFRMKPGLERVVAGIERLGLGNPSQGMVHIVGTNGKGSTAAFLHAMARAHGRTSGVFSSPHFVTPRERILIDGNMLSEHEWIDLANRVYASCPRVDFSYFELLTLMAMLAFVRNRVDLVIMEAGLGGTWDATSAFVHDLTLVTPVGLDHEHVLGSTLEAIATDKAGAIQGGEVVCAPQEEGIADLFRKRAEEKGAGFHRLSDVVAPDHSHDGFVCPAGKIMDMDHTELGLAGPFQKTNGMLALAGWSVFTRFKGWPFSALNCMQGLTKAVHPGRMQVIEGDPTFLLDGAHNLMGLRALAVGLGHMDFCPDVMIFSCMEDKNLLDDLELVRGLCGGRILVPNIPGNDRAMDGRQLAGLLGSRAVGCVNMQEALDWVGTPCKRVLVCGSLFLLGEFFRIRG
ncbi:bifunctional folylpolyglutamate synthase/dihydrofolate synthase [Desulfoplanes sp.]